MRIHRKPSPLAALLLAAVTPALSSAAEPSPPGFDKVLVVVLENTDYSEALKQPGFARLAEEGALLANFHAETHPSQPNYIALVSGSTHGVTSDDKVDLRGPTVVDRLEARGHTWKAYLEDYPGSCFLGEKSGEYARKHNPFASFTNIQKLSERCERMVPAEELVRDIVSGGLPDFSLYIPNLKNDGHDTNAAYASRWLAESFLPALGKTLPRGLLLIVTFDESATRSNDNQVYTVLYGAGVRPGARSGKRYDHYSLLRTIENRFGLGTLQRNDSLAMEVNDVWN